MQAILKTQPLNSAAIEDSRYDARFSTLATSLLVRACRAPLQPKNPPGFVVVRTGIRGQHRLYRPRQFWNEFNCRDRVRVQAALGVAVVESDGHPHPIPLRQIRHRYRSDAAAELPGTFLASHVDWPVGGCRIVGAGHRPG